MVLRPVPRPPRYGRYEALRPLGGVVVAERAEVDLALTLALPFLLAFNIVMNRRLMYNDLQGLCPLAYLRETIFFTLSSGQPGTEPTTLTMVFGHMYSTTRL